jgi:hypothetical protein
MLGVTLSLRTGQAITSCIVGNEDAPLLRAFAPSRFERRTERPQPRAPGVEAR